MSFENQARSMLGSANDAAKLVRNVHLTFMLITAYIAIVIGSTTDVQLLKVSPVMLPLLNVQLPIIEFYILTPWLLLFLHFNLLLQCYLLASKLHLLNTVLSQCDEDVATNIRQQLFGFALSQNIVGHARSSIIRFFLNSLIVFSIVIVPLILLSWAQIRFIPYHNEVITWSHRIVILFDCLLLWIIWPMIVLPENKLKHWIVQNLLWVKKLTGQSSPTVTAKDKITLRGSGQESLMLCSILLLFVSWFVAVQPESNDKGEKVPQFFLTEMLFDLPGKPFRQDLFLKDKLLIKGEPSAKIEVALKGGSEIEKSAALKEVVGLSLQGRDLRFATFEKCVMPKAELSRANLQGAIIQDTFLQESLLLDANLNGANLIRSQLQNSILNHAKLKGAQLIQTNLQSVDLEGANLKGAVLVNAKLMSARLGGSKLQGAVLNSTKMMNADLRGANFEGASWWGANLTGAQMDKDKVEMIKIKVLN